MYVNVSTILLEGNVGNSNVLLNNNLFIVDVFTTPFSDNGVFRNIYLISVFLQLYWPWVFHRLNFVLKGSSKYSTVDVQVNVIRSLLSLAPVTAVYVNNFLLLLILRTDLQEMEFMKFLVKSAKLKDILS